VDETIRLIEMLGEKDKSTLKQLIEESGEL